MNSKISDCTDNPVPWIMSPRSTQGFGERKLVMLSDYRLCFKTKTLEQIPGHLFENATSLVKFQENETW